jgi:predicted membrane chloride channel (bestrophin family)
MTKQQLRILQNLDLPRKQRHNAPVEWMMARAGQGIADGTILDYKGATAKNLQSTMLALRGTYASMDDETSTRMPLAYTHFVQVLVDTFVFLAPVALYSTLGDMSLICVGIITLFYTGLLNLAKIFLDPLDNENFSGNSFDMDIGVLVRESNEGSTRWKNAGARLPF